MIDANVIFDGTLTQGGGITGAAITASATTQASTNIVDLGAARDVGAGEPLGLFVVTTVAFTTTNSATLQISLQVCATSNGTYLTILQSPVYAAADLVAGAAIFQYALPKNQNLNDTSGTLNTPGRFLQLLYTVGTGVFTTGHNLVFAYIAPRLDRYALTTYSRNYTANVYSGEL